MNHIPILPCSLYALQWMYIHIYIYIYTYIPDIQGLADRSGAQRDEDVNALSAPELQIAVVRPVCYNCLAHSFSEHKGSDTHCG